MGKETGPPQVRIVRKGLTQHHYFNYGAKMHSQLLRAVRSLRPVPNPGHRSPHRLPLDAKGNYQLQGYIDRLSKRADGTYEIHDYKTGQKLPTSTKLTPAVSSPSTRLA